MQGLAVTFVAPRQVEVREQKVPEPKDGQLLVRTLYSGISAGTDMLAYRAEIDQQLPLDSSIPALSGRFSYPFCYGYSSVGASSPPMYFLSRRPRPPMPPSIRASQACCTPPWTTAVL